MKDCPYSESELLEIAQRFKKHLKDLMLVPGLDPELNQDFVYRFKARFYEAQAHAHPHPLDAAADQKALHLKEELEVLTEQIHNKSESIKDIFISKYAPQVQAFINGNTETAKLLGYGEKGVDDGHSDVTVDSITNSRPTIEDVYTTAYLTQAIVVKNNQSGSIAKPHDVDRIEIYELMADAMPTVIDLKKWTYLGIAKRGKFLNHFSPLEYNQTVFYIAVYVPKKAGESVVISTGFKSTVQ